MSFEYTTGLGGEYLFYSSDSDSDFFIDTDTESPETPTKKVVKPKQNPQEEKQIQKLKEKLSIRPSTLFIKTPGMGIKGTFYIQQGYILLQNKQFEKMKFILENCIESRLFKWNEKFSFDIKVFLDKCEIVCKDPGDELVNIFEKTPNDAFDKVQEFINKNTPRYLKYTF